MTTERKNELEVIKSLIGNPAAALQRLSALCNVAAYLNSILKEINWVGFYIVGEDKRLHVGPFQGKVACSELEWNKGVCATAWKSKKSVVVDDVSKFEGHIACDSESKSELVVPIINNDKVVAVLDVDSPLLNNFTISDVNFLEKVGQLVSELFSFS